MQTIELEDSNLGEPTWCEIVKNPENASSTIPQAWEYKWEWYYNWEGAMKEAEYRCKRIPSKDEWEQIIDAGIQIPLAGYRLWSNGQYYSQGSNASYWSSSPYGVGSSNASLYSGGGNIANASTRAYGFSVRCLKKDTEFKIDDSETHGFMTTQGPIEKFIEGIPEDRCLSSGAILDEVHAIESLSVWTWVKVSERLPEENQDVIAYTGFSNQLCVYQRDQFRWSAQFRWKWMGNYTIVPTHWAYITLPPNQSNND